MRPHPKRTERQRGRPFTLTDRDIAMLSFIGTCRYVTTRQIARDFISSMDRAQRRVRALFDAALVDLTLQSSTAPNLVSLTRRGLSAVGDVRPDLADTLDVPGPIRVTAGLKHHLAIVDAYGYALGLGRERRAPLTTWSLAGGRLHQVLDFERFRLVPDAIAEFDAPQGPVYVAFEVCRATEPLATTIASKLGRYVPVAEEGRVDALWFVGEGGPGRLASVEHLACERGLDAWTRVMAPDHVVARPIRELPQRGAKTAGRTPTLIPGDGELRKTAQNMGFGDEQHAGDRRADRTVDRHAAQSSARGRR